jgi:hypothetical protein
MSALTGPALVVAALLALAGGQKVLDPTMTVGALRALRLPASAGLVRTGPGFELALGVLSVVVGGAALWALVALSYLAFAAFVVAALRAGTMIGSCGCFGRDETPPHISHVLINLVCAGLASAVAVAAPPSVLDAVSDEPMIGLAVVAVSALAVALLYAAYVDLPRALRKGSSGWSAHL